MKDSYNEYPYVVNDKNLYFIAEYKIDQSFIFEDTLKDQNVYTELKKYFSTYVGQYQNNNENFATSSFPYIIEGSKNFNILIPENLGYIERDNKFSIDIIKNNFYKLSRVRGYTGGFFFHPYMNIDYLKQVISYLKDNDAEFLNLKDINNYVKIDDINIKSQDGKIDVTYDKNKSNEKSKSEINFENSMSNINKIIVIFVSVVLVVFTIIFIFFRFINRRKFRRRQL